MDRNLQDAMLVARNVIMDPRLVPGGGALEMALAQYISERAKVMDGLIVYVYGLLYTCNCIIIECSWDSTMAV